MKINLIKFTLLSLIIFGLLANSSAIAFSQPNLPSSPYFFEKPMSDHGNSSNDVYSSFPEKPTKTPPKKYLQGISDLNSTVSVTDRFGFVKGKVIDESTGKPISHARVYIPELRVSTITQQNGEFEMRPISIDKKSDTSLFVTLEASAPGYGKHTMVNVGVFPGDTATVTLLLEKGNKPTKWFGLMKPEQRGKRQQPPTPQKNIDSESVDDYQQLSTSAQTTSTRNYSSQTVPPPYILISIREPDEEGLPDPEGEVIRRDLVDFDFYVKHVLPVEWEGLWHEESLKAGAMAVREYAWYWVNQGGKYPLSDLDNSTNCQVYNPYISYASTDNAVDAVAANGWYQNGVIFQSQYCAGSYDSTNPCGSNKMSQWGSKYWADQGRTYEWILNHYYSPTLTDFTIVPHSPKLYASNTASDSITVNFSSPGAVWYQVNKLVNGSWENVVYFGPETNFIDTNVVSGGAYSYMASAWNQGWSDWSFNSGYMAAIAKSFSNPPPLVTNPFFITDQEIGLRAISSDTENTYYYHVVKWNGYQWQTFYSGVPITWNIDPLNFTVPNPDVQLPLAYIDAYDNNFVCFDRDLTANSGYYYSLRVYKPGLGWSDFSNSGGHIAIRTELTY